MKAMYVSRLSLPALLLLAIAPAASAGKKPELTSFFGKYTGSGVVTEDTDSAGGPVAIRISGPKNGRSARVAIAGTLFEGSDSAPIANALRFFGKHRFFSQALVFGIDTGPVPPPPSVGTYRARKNTIRFSAPWVYEGKNGLIIGSLTRRGQRQLLLSYQVVATNYPLTYSFSFTLRRSGR